MPKINISDLSKEVVILALFKNVYRKSEEAKQTKSTLMSLSPNAPGIYSEPKDFEISEKLRREKYINYLGCVKFSMDFSGNIIDTDLYDELHKPGANGVESAAVVIERLRPKRELKEESKSSAPAATHLSHASSSFTATMTKISANKSADKTIAEEKLTALLGKPCRLTHLYTDKYIFEFSSEQSYETLQKDATSLASKGITVVAKAPNSLCGGLVKIPANLEFAGSLSDMVTKLGSVSPIVPSSTITSST